MTAYPSAWEADVVLADGMPMHLRPIRPDDAAALVALHARLSPQSVYYRFFSPKPRLTEREVERFTNVDFVDRVALVAELGDDLIAVGRFDRWPGQPEAEVAFVVDDEHQGRGLGALLLEHLAAIALASGIVRFTAEVLPDNRPMLSTFRKAGYDVHHRFDGGIIDISFELEPTQEVADVVERREQRADSRSIARLLQPRSVAVIGAGTQRGSIGAVVLRNLLAEGFDGPVYPVNPTTPHVGGIPATASILDIVDDVHLAIVAVPASVVPQVLDECALKRVRGVVVISTGFADAGPDGAAVEREIVERARRNGMRLVGPASMGVITTSIRDRPGALHASFAPTGVLPGRLALSLQSGPLATALLEQARRIGVGFSCFVSLGNKGDVSANDLLNYWSDDPATDVVLLYIESFGNPRKFLRTARRVSRTKPVVAVRGAAYGVDAATTDALYQQAGVIRVNTVAELLDMGRLLVGQPLPAGTRVAVITDARSPGVLALERVRFEGLSVAELGVDTRTALHAALPASAMLQPLVDLTPKAVAADYRAALLAVGDDPGVDVLLVIHAPPLLGDDDDVAAVIAEAAATSGRTTVAIMLGRGDGPLREGSGVPAFAFPEPAVVALARAARYAAWRQRPAGTVASLPDVDHDRARALVDHALAVRPEGTLLPLSVTRELLACAGIEFAPALAITSIDAAVDAADRLGYPVALKAAGLTRLVRSEDGGVALDLASADDVRASYARMADHLGPAMAEAIVQRMAPGGVEVIVAIEHHPAIGPVIGFGLGGAFADVIGDRVRRSAPLTTADAVEMIDGSRARAALASAGVDIDALIALLCRVSALVDAFAEIDQLSLNPVLASPSGAVVVDASVHVAPGSTVTTEAVPTRRLT